MKTFQSRWLLPIVAALAVTLAGCASTGTKTADVADSIQKSIAQAGFKDVSVKQDRDKGVVTLGGHVAADADKAQAESIAKSFAGTQVVANEIAVVPPGDAADAKKINSDLDKGIESNLDAALVTANLHDAVKYSVKNHVVTLTGDVDSQAKRAMAATVAAGVLNVEQVVNNLQVKAQKATSTM
ncbi:MAG: BON domain-containing protein [Bryobacteraceae bacterium]